MKKHAWLVAGLLVFDTVVWAISRVAYLRTFDAVDVWQAQMALAQGLLLFNTLLVVWVYTIATESQAESVRSQIALSEAEHRALQLARWQENKPVVFVDQRHDPDRGPNHYRYVATNVGGGFAVNVYGVFQHSSNNNQRRTFWESLGALAPGGERVLLESPGRENRYVIVAEGVKTRTRRWNPTLHLVLPDGRVMHKLKYVTGDNADASSLEAEMEIYEYVNTQHEAFWRELNAFFEDIRRQALAADETSSRP